MEREWTPKTVVDGFHGYRMIPYKLVSSPRLTFETQRIPVLTTAGSRSVWARGVTNTGSQTCITLPVLA